MLTPENQVKILALYFGENKKIRAISRELGIDRKSVRNVIRRRKVRLEAEPSFRRSSRLDPYKDAILNLLRDDPKTTGVVIMQRIRQAGYDGGYTILRDWLKLQRQEVVRPKEAFFKMHFTIGQVAQVDWGEFGDVFGDGVKIHCFVMVLCYSRLIYVEFTRSEKFEEFIRCHENAFRYFGGLVPAECWFDNLPTAVTERMGRLIRFNARFLAYIGHHHIKPHACNLARGNEKGRVENGVKYVRHNFWHSRHFKDFSDLCVQASNWRDQDANHREHRATRKIPRLVFDHEESTQLMKANPVSYETDEIFSEVVRPDFHIIYETNQYSVPWTLSGCVVTVRVNASQLRVFYKDRFVTQHVRCYQKYQKPFTKPEHEQGLREIKPQGKTEYLHWQISVLESYGPSLKKYLQCLRYSKRSLRQEISSLMALGTIYGESRLAETIDALLKRGSIGIEQVELALKHHQRNQAEPQKPAPMKIPNERLARIPARIDLRQYDQLILKSRKRPSESGSPVKITNDSQENNENHGTNHPTQKEHQKS